MKRNGFHTYDPGGNSIREHSPLLIPEPPLQVLPGLALLVGLSEAIFLQQLHYWVRKSQHVRDGRAWVYNTYEEWGQQFPFWSRNTLERTIKSLEAQGAVLTANYNQHPMDRTKWYSIDYDALTSLAVTQREPRIGEQRAIYDEKLHSVTAPMEGNRNDTAPIEEAGWPSSG